MTKSHQPVRTPTLLLILDGFGHSESTEHNAIAAADTPTWDRLLKEHPHTLLETSGLAVGLPEGQMGNSEVGHMTLGAGRVVYQNFTRINKAIADGDFKTNRAYNAAIDAALERNGALHILGLLSPGGVHSHEEHIHAMVELAAERGVERIHVHAFLDGRDTPPRSARPSLELLQAKLDSIGRGRIASVCGRYYAMDRDQRWERVETAYDMLTQGVAPYRAASAVEALDQAYARDENDEFVQATMIGAAGEAPVHIADGDAVIHMNFRPDRARQLTQALIDPGFDGFARTVRPQLAAFVMTTEYSADFQVDCAFPPEELVNSFGEYLAHRDKTQLRIAETEKYAHVTFFFSGGQEEHFAGEERILVPSPKVATYDLKPEMSAQEVTDELTAAIRSGRYDAIVCNYANGDMVGHTGVFSAAVKAVETLDHCLAQIVEALNDVGGQCLITADHGNVEEMFDHGSGQASTQHSTLPVPLVYVGPRTLQLKSGGSLADIAPTLLTLMDLPQPAEMTGHSLVEA